ncbi:50S ribosomal protein L18 [Buchnera aphidicola (Nipponaphis monzeni)]|uniref:Large ribosomal subunit protein uL18 n=2 Tax=Buchnera aphidicola TaxID=9 RepID=A0A455TAP0_9GAMM|nr:50S ribosomal protein L18 [Buchnera aphidicola (Nipponaphis monzeni)]
MFVKNNKKSSRLRRALRIRRHLYRLNAIRLVIHKTSRHMYAQIVSPDSLKIIAVASTLEKVISTKVKYTGNKIAAGVVGEFIAKRAVKKGVSKISFDRSGFKYHGRVLELANAARKFGLIF